MKPVILRRTRLPRLLRIHFWITFFAFISYLLFGLSVGGDFFSHDIGKKLQVLADEVIVVTATVLGPPTKPVVTATLTCVSGAPRVVLDWANDAATSTWSIDRDSSPLTSGLTQSQYTDTAVSINTTYSYVVTATGPMAPGSAVSDPVSATTLDCPNILPDPTVNIETLGEEDVREKTDGGTLLRRRPEVTGTTNIENAIIDIVLTNPTIRVRISANANGYFSWIPPRRLDTGNHILLVTATDPNDGSRTITDQILFETKGSGSGNTAVSKKEGLDDTKVPLTSKGRIPDFEVRIENQYDAVLQSETLTFIVTSEKVFPVGAVLEPVLVGPDGRDRLRLPSYEIRKENETEIRFVTHVPLSIEAGEYIVRVDVVFGGEIASRGDAVVVRDWPFFRLGEGVEITYAETASFLGTFFFGSLTFLFFALLFFLREYELYLHAFRHVTEKNLSRFFGLGGGKGVSRK